MRRPSPSLGVFAPRICPKICLSADKDLRSKKRGRYESFPWTIPMARTRLTSLSVPLSTSNVPVTFQPREQSAHRVVLYAQLLHEFSLFSVTGFLKTQQQSDCLKPQVALFREQLRKLKLHVLSQNARPSPLPSQLWCPWGPSRPSPNVGESTSCTLGSGGGFRDSSGRA